MHIEIVSIGDELLNGMVVNTNAAFMSRALFEKGYDISRHTVFSDDPLLLDKELRAALSRSSIIIATGGLGPTLDDHTRTIAAALFGSAFAYNETVAHDLKKRFGNKLKSLTDQATIPINATPLLNSVGTAPGLVFTGANKLLILLPGVPLEMQTMFMEQVLPLLQQHMPAKGKKESVQMHFCLLAESELDPLLKELKKSFPDVQVGIYPCFGKVSVVLHSAHADQLQAFKQAIESQFPTYLFLSKKGKIEEDIQKWFIQHGKCLALAESCTGGSIASQLVSEAGASEYFLGSFVTYSDALKMHLLGVSKHTLETHGAVSANCVKEMLLGVFENSNADFAIAVSGIAGPTGGSIQKPVGTIWAAIGEKAKAPDIGSFYISGPRSKVIEVTTHYLLGALFRKTTFGIPAFPVF